MVSSENFYKSKEMKTNLLEREWIEKKQEHIYFWTKQYQTWYVEEKGR